MTGAPERSPAGPGLDFDAEDLTPLPAPRRTGDRKAAALPGQADRLCLFRTLTAFLNLGVLTVHLPGGTGGPSDIPECEGVWEEIVSTSKGLGNLADVLG